MRLADRDQPVLLGDRHQFILLGDAFFVHLKLVEDGGEIDGFLLYRRHDLGVEDSGYKGGGIKLFGRLYRLDLGDGHDCHGERQHGNEPDHEQNAEN